MTVPWSRALVTGASSGIGRAIATQLAAGGTPVVLVARDEGHLTDLATTLRDRHGVQADVLPADLTEPAAVARVAQRLAAEPAVDLLVNNAGVGTYGDFAVLDPVREVQEIELNVVALVRLTHAAVAAMVGRGGGRVLNVSSMASLQPTPLQATYGATKAFVTHFSESLHEELRGGGVHVTAVLPGFTRTGFQARAGLTASAGMPGFVWQSAEACAAEALAAAAAGRSTAIPGMLNKVTAAVAAPVPRRLKARLVRRMAPRFAD